MWPKAAGPTVWVDVTVRNSAAARYSHTTAPGASALAAEREKRKRYDSKVLPFAVETGGRLGLEAATLLEFLAARAASASRARGAVEIVRPLTRWHSALSEALVKAAARTAALALDVAQ
eukprot:6523876-Alexandrium_andersonii.AAC.1